MTIDYCLILHPQNSDMIRYDDISNIIHIITVHIYLTKRLAYFSINTYVNVGDK